MHTVHKKKEDVNTEQKDKQALLFIITGASGVGKGTIYKALLQSDIGLHKSISATTRTPRVGEEHGVEYFFLGTAEFEDKLSKGEFLEHAKVYQNYYGTPKQVIVDNLKQNKDTILEIDIEGAKQIKAQFDKAVWIFVVPPDVQTLKNRLDGRNTDSDEIKALRLAQFDSEMIEGQKADYIVVNDNLDTCIDTIKNIIQKERENI